MTRRSQDVCSLFLLLAGSAALTSVDAKPAPADDLVKSVTVIEKSGGRVSWSSNGKWIALDQKDEDGFYDVFVMRPDGSEKRCLTCGAEGLPQKHNGSPEFHPSGAFIVFTAEQQSHDGNSKFSRPGQGLYSDIWLMTADGSDFWKIVELPDNDPNYGTVHPHFSKDGSKLSWSMMYEKANISRPQTLIGSWKLKSADFAVTPAGPRLVDVREHQPKVEAFYENHGFSKDGSKILFSSSHKARWPLDHNLYAIELETGKIEHLSGKNRWDHNYDEHGQYSPDGTKIVWGTNRKNRNKGMDYWMMNADGTDQKRVTYFNHPTFTNYLPKGEQYVACDLSFHPDGSKFAAWIFTDLGAQEGLTAIIELKRAAVDHSAGDTVEVTAD